MVDGKTVLSFNVGYALPTYGKLHSIFLTNRCRVNDIFK